MVMRSGHNGRVRRLLDELRASRLLVAVPAVPSRTLLAVEVCLQEGLRAISVPAGHPDLLLEVVAHVGDRGVVGVHGVIAAAQVDEAAAGRAGFVVSALGSPPIASAARRRGMGVVLGGLTPTEVTAAAAVRPDAVAVTPADAMGTGYATLAVSLTSDVPLVAVNLTGYSAGQWLAAGALAVVPDPGMIGDVLTGGDVGSFRTRVQGFATEGRAAPPPGPVGHR